MTTTLPSLYLSAPVTMTVSGAELVAADSAGRTLTGIAVPYGPVGNTSRGPVTVRAGAITVPADLHRVKLVDEHRTPPQPIGVAITAADSPAGLRMTFRMGATPAGDAALLEAAEGIRDAFSVELADVVMSAAGEVTSARLTAVALVTVPAFSDARVSGIAASENTTPEGNNTMTPEQRARLAALIAQTTRTAEEESELSTLAVLSVSNPEAPADPAAVVADPAATAAPAAPAVAASASVPVSLSASLTTPPAGDLNSLYAALARTHTGQSRPSLEAALSNITNTANIWTSPDQYAGQLWSGLRYVRRFVPNSTPGKLTSYKVRGWRWVLPPVVADYAGDKAAVPSNAPTTEEVETTAARLAGAHDVDRKFRDFNDTEFFKNYYEAMTESYAIQSDDKARAFQLASAYLSAEVLSAAGGDTILTAALVAKMELEDTNSVGTPDFYYVNKADYRELLNVSNNDVSAFLDALGIDPKNFRAVNGVPAGSVVAGVKPATTFYELGTSPVRVDAVDMVNGGEDVGVFGYYATIKNHPKGIVRVAVGA